MEFNSKKKKNNRFSDIGHNNWLDDEDWSGSVKMHSRKNPSAFDKGKDDEKVEFNIKLSLPKAKIQKVKSIGSKSKNLTKKVLSNTSKKSKKAKISFALILILVIIGVIFTMYKKNNNDAKEVAGASTGSQSGESTGPQEESPNYKILYPGAKNASTVGKIVRISPPGQNPAYTYVDTLGNIQINVTQQELPDKFKTDQDAELDKLAKSNNQNDIIQVDGVKVYSGQSTKGAQSLTFIKGNLLIFIKAGNKISDEAWVAYISALHS